jgi:hypothetical protein
VIESTVIELESLSVYQPNAGAGEAAPHDLRVRESNHLFRDVDSTNGPAAAQVFRRRKEHCPTARRDVQ